jgi:hypothetical protein
MTYRDANAGAMLEFFDFTGKPPFEHPPALDAALNPFEGPLPARSGSPGFHPIATGLEADSLPPATYHVQHPPRR